MIPSVFYKSWWKGLAVLLVFYTIIAGLLMDAPRLNILNETVRNLHFHVPMWFGMIIMLTVSVIYSIKYLSSNRRIHDHIAIEFANTGFLFGLLGIISGAIWARFTWGEWWSNDPKQNGAAITMLIYAAYLVLRNSMEDPQQRARVSAVYNIFAFSTLIPLLFVLPRLTDSLHPGSGGNPGFNAYDLDSKLRLVFYPAVIGWALTGVWMATVKVRVREVSTYFSIGQ